MSRGFGAMQRTILKTMEAAMRYELHNGALATPLCRGAKYTTALSDNFKAGSPLSFLVTKHPPGPFPITPAYRQCTTSPLPYSRFLFSTFSMAYLPTLTCG